MTKEEKEKLVIDLIDTVKAGIIDKLDDMPAEWDGWELRTYIAERFTGVVWSSMRNPSRRRKYMSDVLVNGL